MTSTDTTNKPFKIEKRQVYEAYKAVKSNHGAAGVDGQTLEMFESDLGRNLYKIWNRLSSGAYFPPPVRAVPIPKKTGGDAAPTDGPHRCRSSLLQRLMVVAHERRQQVVDHPALAGLDLRCDHHPGFEGHRPLFGFHPGFGHRYPRDVGCLGSNGRRNTLKEKLR